MAKETAAQKKVRLAAEAKVAASTYAQIQSTYGLTDAILNMDTTGSLKAAFDQIRTKKITDPTLAANILAGTEWFKTHGTQVTQNLALERTSPGVFKQNVDAIKTEIAARAKGLGKVLSGADIDAIARDSYVYGKAYNSQDVLNQIVTKGGTSTTGDFANNRSALATYAAEMGIKTLDSKWFDDASNDVLMGANISDYKGKILEQAKGLYKGVADQLDAGAKAGLGSGATLKSIASPYVNMMANTFEMPNPDDVDLATGPVFKALTSQDDKGNHTLQPLWDFQQQLKKDDRYFVTKQAHQDFADLSTAIAKQFGRA